MTKTVDQWAAEACGVEIAPPPREGSVIIYVYWRLKGQGYIYPWTIKDPRCREILREHFELNTQFRPALPKARVFCYSAKFDVSEAGKTIEDAEIACITAIFEASQ